MCHVPQQFLYAKRSAALQENHVTFFPALPGCRCAVVDEKMMSEFEEKRREAAAARDRIQQVRSTAAEQVTLFSIACALHVALYVFCICPILL